jgi:hypothetical protein
MQAWMHDVPKAIIESKSYLRNAIPDLADRFAKIDHYISEEVAAVKAEQAAGGAVPELSFKDIQAGKVTEAQRAHIRRRGCLVIRGVFDVEQIHQWNDQIAHYIEDNDYIGKSKSKVGLDKYFSTLQSGAPQIFSLYWSKPQMQARQHPHLAQTRSFLNHLWDFKGPHGDVFHPDRECTYADRIRRRAPGAVSLGLSPHADAGSVERWCDPTFHEVYKEVYFGDVMQYQAFKAYGRDKTHEIPSPAVCSLFRTFQGWTALSRQGPGDGTLKLVPIANSMAWILLRALQEDVPADDLCDAKGGRALSASQKWHAKLLDAEVSIPMVEPGDTVWWHPDMIHSVEDEHKGLGYSNVIYIGSAPYCEKNAGFQKKQMAAFEAGLSCPDFAAENYEVDFLDRAQKSDLSELGLKQMGYLPW